MMAALEDEEEPDLADLLPTDLPENMLLTGDSLEPSWSVDDVAAAAYQADSVDVNKQCWGWLLSAANTLCTPGFEQGRGHFKCAIRVAHQLPPCR